MKRYFITSTGTGIGKTYVTSLLAKQLLAEGKSVRLLKPIISGYIDGEENDTTILAAAISASSPLIGGKRVVRRTSNTNPLHTASVFDEISPWRFRAPLSPDMAARREGREIDFDKLVEFCQRQPESDYLLIEGVGGIMVPLNENKTVRDWIKALEIPVLLVCGSYLGSISHTLTALESLKAVRLDNVQIIISESAESACAPEELLATLRNFTDAHIEYLPRGASIIKLL